MGGICQSHGHEGESRGSGHTASQSPGGSWREKCTFSKPFHTHPNYRKETFPESSRSVGEKAGIRQHLGRDKGWEEGECSSFQNGKPTSALSTSVLLCPPRGEDSPLVLTFADVISYCQNVSPSKSADQQVGQRLAAEPTPVLSRAQRPRRVSEQMPGDVEAEPLFFKIPRERQLAGQERRGTRPGTTAGRRAV